MAKKKYTVLLVEDSPSQAEAYKGYLAKEPIEVVHVMTGEDAIGWLDHSVPDVILLDLQLPGIHGLDVLKQVVARELPSPVVVITDDGSVDVAVVDVRMPSMGGLELAQKLREARPDLPILFMTGISEERNKEIAPALAAFAPSTMAPRRS